VSDKKAPRKSAAAVSNKKAPRKSAASASMEINLMRVMTKRK